MKITDEMLFQHAGKARDLWLSTLPQKDALQSVPYSHRFKRRMRILLKAAARTPRANHVLLYMRRSVAAVLVIAVLAFGGMMTVKAYREKVIEIAIQIFHDLTRYQLASSSENRELSAVEFGYMPEGMELVEEILMDSVRYVYYEDADGNYFSLNQIVVAAGDYLGGILDTEDSVIERFEIRGNEAISNTKYGSTVIFWTEENGFFELQGNITAEKLKRIAENLKISMD